MSEVSEREARVVMFENAAPGYTCGQEDAIIATAMNNPGVPVMFDTQGKGKMGFVYKAPDVWGLA